MSAIEKPSESSTTPSQSSPTSTSPPQSNPSPQPNTSTSPQITPSVSAPVSRKAGSSAQRNKQQPVIPNIENQAFKKYQFGDELGKGAFGRVFRGLNITTGEVVAIKQIEKDKIRESLPQIMKELELLQKLDHPNIVKFIEYIDTKDHLFFTLEFVEGGSLFATMRRFGSFPESLLVIYITQVLRGIQYLHQQNVIHRDIKGANILLTKEGQCKLADFGSCTYEALSRGDPSNVNTPFWSAPEILEQKPAVPSSDIWSLGCTLLELLTGKPPYWDLGPELAIPKILNDQIPPFPSPLSPDLEEFLSMCFIRDANQRPSAEKLLSTPWISKLWGGHDGFKESVVSKEKRRKSIKIPKSLEWSFKLPGLSSQIEKNVSPSTPSSSSSSSSTSTSSSSTSSTSKSPRSGSNITPDPDMIRDMISKDRSTRGGAIESPTSQDGSGNSNSTSTVGGGGGSSGTGGTGSAINNNNSNNTVTGNNNTGTGSNNTANNTGNTNNNTSGGGSGGGGGGEGTSSEKEGMMQNILELTEQLGKETDEKKALQRSVEELKARLDKLASEKDNLLATLKDLKSQANAEQKAMVDELRELLQKLTSTDNNATQSGTGTGEGGGIGGVGGTGEENWMMPGARCIATSAKLGQPYDAIISSVSTTEPGYYRVIFIGFGDEAELPASALRPYDDTKKGKKGDRYKIWKNIHRYVV